MNITVNWDVKHQYKQTSVISVFPNTYCHFFETTCILYMYMPGELNLFNVHACASVCVNKKELRSFKPALPNHTTLNNFPVNILLRIFAVIFGHS